tara:strand:- start:2401 stop:3285 length:885 start_codon:yes stop_codon:yes gene_type:complete
MVTFTELGRLGRLGNQLFQYAALRAISLEKKCKIKIPDPATMEWQNQKCYLKYFSLECEYLEQHDYPHIQYRFHEPDHTQLHSEVFSVPDNTDFVGYFQNYGYFSKHEEQIRKEFILKDDIKEPASDYIEQFRKVGDPNAEIVSVHMRRGDNVDGTNPDSSNFYGNGDKLSKDSAFGQYFYPAIQTFEDKNVKFLVFSGGSRRGDKHNQTDIEWCKANFNGENIYYCEGNQDIVDFEIMRQCDHHINCHMTSFGWWAAFLNDSPDKIVVAPRSYTIPDDGRAKKGFYPPTWRLI